MKCCDATVCGASVTGIVMRRAGRPTHALCEHGHTSLLLLLLVAVRCCLSVSQVVGVITTIEVTFIIIIVSASSVAALAAGAVPPRLLWLAVISIRYSVT